MTFIYMVLSDRQGNRHSVPVVFKSVQSDKVLSFVADKVKEWLESRCTVFVSLEVNGITRYRVIRDGAIMTARKAGIWHSSR